MKSTTLQKARHANIELACQQRIEVALPIGVGARANEGLAIDQEGWCAAHPALSACAIIGRDLRCLLIAVDALPERANIELKLLSVAQECLEILAAATAPFVRGRSGVQAVVHRPKAALGGGAVGDMCGQQRAGMNIDQRKIAVYEINFAGLDILRIELRLRLTDKGEAERSLVVAVLDHSDRRIRVAQRALLGRGCGILCRRGGQGWLAARRGWRGRCDARRSLAATRGDCQRKQHKHKTMDDRR